MNNDQNKDREQHREQREQAQERPDAKAIAALAARGEKPSFGMTSYEWLFWYECRDIYMDYQSRTADLDTGTERKNQATARYEKAKREADELRDLSFRCAALWKNIEEAATEDRQARNDGDRIDAADKMMNVVYGLLGGADG